MNEIACTCSDPKPDGCPYTHRHNCPTVLIPLRQAWFREYHGKDQYCPCDKCPDRLACEYVYDIYNNDDDCLATK